MPDLSTKQSLKKKKPVAYFDNDAPVNPTPGTIWFDADDVQVSPSSEAVAFSDNDAPSTPEVGKLWVDLDATPTAGGASTLDGLSDVVAPTPSTDDVLKYSGTEWVNSPAPQTGISPTLVDAKGDLIVATAADTVARLAVGGTTGHVLTVDPAEASGMKWAAASGGGGTTWTESGSNPTGGSAGDWHYKISNQDPMLFRNDAGTWEPRLMLSRMWDRNTRFWDNSEFTKYNGAALWGPSGSTTAQVLTTVATGLTRSGANWTLPNANTNASYWGTPTYGYVGTQAWTGTFGITTLPTAANVQFGIPINIVNAIFMGLFQVTSAGVATFGSSSGALFTFAGTVTNTTYNKFVMTRVPGAFLVAQINGSTIHSSAVIPDAYATAGYVDTYGPTLYFKGSGSGTAAVVNVSSVEFYQ